MSALRVINLGVRFLLELGALAATGYWAATLRAPVPLRIALAVAGPVCVAAIWGLFIAPKARYPTGHIGQAGLGLVVFLAAAAALQDRGHGALALTFAIVAVVSSILLAVLPQ